MMEHEFPENLSGGQVPRRGTNRASLAQFLSVFLRPRLALSSFPQLVHRTRPKLSTIGLWTARKVILAGSES